MTEKRVFVSTKTQEKKVKIIIQFDVCYVDKREKESYNKYNKTREENKTMTNTFKLYISMVALFVSILFGAVGNMENSYSMNATVDSVKDGVITFCDSTDNLWKYEQEEVNVREGDSVTLHFSTNGTDETRLDDEITSFSIDR